MIRIVHCEDSRAFARLVKLWLQDHADMEVVHVAHNADAAREAIAREQPDIVLLDAIPSGTGTFTAREVRELAPGARVIVYSGLPQEAARHTIERGDAYLAKGDDETELVAAIRRLTA